MLGTSFAGHASAHERQLHLGLEAGVSTIGVGEEGSVGGYGGTALVAYGLDDVFNLRAQWDVQVYDLPGERTSALVYAPTFGAEYVVDVIEWVLYGGLLVGPARVAIQDEADLSGWQAVAQLPVGLKYLLTGEISSPVAVALEAQPRFYLFGAEGRPGGTTIAGFLRFEYIFSLGDADDIPNPQVQPGATSAALSGPLRSVTWTP